MTQIQGFQIFKNKLTSLCSQQQHMTVLRVCMPFTVCFDTVVLATGWTLGLQKAVLICWW